MTNAIFEIKKYFPELTLEIFVEFLNTHYTDLELNAEFDMAEEFKEWAYVNHYL